jgi:HTH-type transcriptional regulator/antitoxin HipB
MQSHQLGNLIRFHRRRAGLSQAELAKHCGVSRSVVQDLEAGKGRSTWGNIMAVLGVLNVQFQPTGPLVGEWLEQQEKDPVSTNEEGRSR